MYTEFTGNPIDTDYIEAKRDHKFLLSHRNSKPKICSSINFGLLNINKNVVT